MEVAGPGELANGDRGTQSVAVTGDRPRPRNAWGSRGPVLVLLLAVFFSMGHFAGAFQKDQEILRAKAIAAEKLEIRDSDKKLKASLSQLPKGGAVLSFFDQTGGSPLTMGIDEKGTPIISLYDGKKALRVNLGIDPNDNTPALNLFDTDGVPALTLGITKGFGPQLTIGRKGQGQILMSVANGRASSIQISDSMSKPRIVLMVSESEPAIMLLGENNAVRSSWQVNSDGSVSFSLLDGQARHRLVIMTDKSGKPTIKLLDPDNKESKTL